MAEAGGKEGTPSINDSLPEKKGMHMCILYVHKSTSRFYPTFTSHFLPSSEREKSVWKFTLVSPFFICIIFTFCVFLSVMHVCVCVCLCVFVFVCVCVFFVVCVYVSVCVSVREGYTYIILFVFEFKFMIVFVSLYK